MQAPVCGEPGIFPNDSMSRLKTSSNRWRPDVNGFVAIRHPSTEVPALRLCRRRRLQLGRIHRDAHRPATRGGGSLTGMLPGIAETGRSELPGPPGTRRGPPSDSRFRFRSRFCARGFAAAPFDCSFRVSLQLRIFRNRGRERIAARASSVSVISTSKDRAGPRASRDYPRACGIKASTASSRHAPTKPLPDG